VQPSGFKHTVLDTSRDCEVLEIIVLAHFKTEKHADRHCDRAILAPIMKHGFA
jgi:hypothetical protein